MLFIFNPRSGKAQIRNRLMDILDIFTKAGYEVSVHVTQRPKDAMEVAAARGNDADLIVCSGGDGTLNETISGMMMLDRIPAVSYTHLVYRLAKAAFGGEYDGETILKWLKVFYRRFFSQQFKRSCLPDGPQVGSVAVSPRRCV